jgi:hypothetical protein
VANHSEHSAASQSVTPLGRERTDATFVAGQVINAHRAAMQRRLHLLIVAAAD